EHGGSKRYVGKYCTHDLLPEIALDSVSFKALSMLRLAFSHSQNAIGSACEHGFVSSKFGRRWNGSLVEFCVYFSRYFSGLSWRPFGADAFNLVGHTEQGLDAYRRQRRQSLRLLQLRQHGLLCEIGGSDRTLSRLQKDRRGH